jgi:RND family efflux transporter MFP subunit
LDLALLSLEQKEKHMRMRNLFLKGVLPLVILAFGLLAMRAMIMNRPAPLKKERDNPGALVETVVVAKEAKQALVKSNGTVQAAQEIQVTMQVNGSVIWIASEFASGGFFQRGDRLFKIDSTDYELALERAKASLVKAETDFLQTEGKAQIARQEWERLNKDSNIEPNPLVVYEPQMAAAQANVAAARAALSQAELDLTRTEVTAPFNCRVRSKQLGRGQYVRIGQNVAVLVSTDTAEIIVPLPLEDLPWINIPEDKQAKGAEAFARIQVDGQTYEWHGEVDRSLGEVDAKSRMAQIVVEISHPYEKKSRNGGNGIALEVGMFVDVFIHGRTVQGVIVLPRKGLRDNATVWIMDPDFKLRVKQVTPIRYEQNDVWIEAGLNDNDKVVLTSLSGGAEGMQLRPVVKGDN